MPFLAGNSVEEDIYLQNRLKWAMSAPVPASVRVDLAQDDNLDDDAFEQAVSVMGGSQAGSYGLGLSEVFSEFLSRSPRTVPVQDITALQKNLIRQGYMRPGTEATGKWDSTFAAAMRRADRDTANELRSGKNYISAPTATVLRYLGETLPSGVWQGIVGTAKGMVQQAPETIERGGFVGGALTAGAIGAAVGSVLPGVGTAAVGGIAALAGGVAGFLSDFFQEDEDEEQQGLSARTWDALTPWDEYKGGREGAQRLFEDLGFIVSAASLITAGGAAARLTTQGVTAAAAGGLRTSLTSFNPAARAGVLSRLGAGATKPLSSNAASWWIKSSQYVRTNPLLKTVRGPYGQLTQASLVGRLAGGVGSGEDDTAIEKGIKSTARLGAGKHLPVSIPFFAPDGEVSDLIDVVASMAIWPEKLLANPKNVGKAGKALNLDAANLNLDPYISVAQHSPGGKTLSLADSRQAALEMLGKTPEERAAANTFYRWNYGVNQRASELVSSKVAKLDDPWKQEDLFNKAKGRLVRKATKEAADGDFTTAKEILSRSYEQPTHFSAYIRGIEGVGSDLEKGSAYREAAFLLQDANSKGLIASTSKRAPKFSDFDVAVARAKATEFEKEAKQLLKAADKQPGLSTAERIANKTEADRLTQEAKRLRTEAERAVKKAQAAKKTTRTGFRQEVPSFDEWAKGKHIYDYEGTSRVVEDSLADARRLLPTKGKPGYHLETADVEGDVQRAMVYRDAKGRIQGLLGLGEKGGKVSEVSIAVDPALRRQGIGTRLFDEAEKVVPGAKAASGKSGYTDAGARLAYSRFVTEQQAKGLPGVVPARKYQPPGTYAKLPAAMKAPGDPGYLTRQEADRLADRYDELADNVRATWQNHIDSTTPDLQKSTREAYHSAQRELDALATDLQFRQVLEPGTEVLGTVRVPDPPKDISTKLRKIARLRGSEVEVPQDVAQKLDELGYVAINTGQDVLHLSDVPKVLELHGVGDYSVKERFYEGLKSMGLGKRIDPDKGVSEIRYANTRAELQHVLASEGIGLTGDSAARTLQKTLDSKLVEKPGRAFVGPFVVDEAKTGIGKFQLPRQDWSSPGFVDT
jgi:ribosomal protein S18 acetylase RimI-like enzyme